MGLIGGLFLSLSASAIYDFFMRIMEIKESSNTEILLMSAMFIVGPSMVAFLLFRKVFKGLEKEKDSKK